MRKVFILFLIASLIIPVEAIEFTAPEAPQSAQQYMPDTADDLGEGFWIVLQNVLYTIKPGIAEASKVCLSLIAISLLTGLLTDLSGSAKNVIGCTSTAIVGIILLRPVRSLIRLGADAVQQISQYGKLLLPVMTAAMAAEGSVTRSGALYTATAIFDAILSSVISDVLIPLVYFLLCISVACCVSGQKLLTDMRKFLKWLPSWLLKIILYIFTGYISITGVVAGSTDAAMLKATKLTISGMVPVVGNILSDASEAVLVSAGVMKSSVGVYGLLAVIAIWIGPFVEIGIQYLILKLTAGICGTFAQKQTIELMNDFSAAMGLMLGMTGAVCLVFLISTICFLKGVI